MNTQSNERTSRRFQTPLLIATAVVGGVALLAVIVTTLFAGISSRIPAIAALGTSGAAASTSETGVAGVTELEIDASRGDVVVEFADVAEARLHVEGGDRWRMERDGDTLVVKSRNGLFDWGPDLCFGVCGEHRATLTLPRELAGVDAEFELGAGALSAEGEFGALQLDVGAGRAQLAGSARSVDAEISAGSADIDLAGVQSASFEVSAGKGNVLLSGAAPSNVEASVSAGSLMIELPDAVYSVTSDVSAGGLDNELRTDPASPNRVTVDVSAGSLTLRTAGAR